MTGIGLGESPRWHAGRLWLSDWGTQQIISVNLEGRSETILQAPSFPFCFDWLPDERMLIVSGSEGSLLCRQPDGSLLTYADLTSLARTPWKDIVVDGRGNAYVGNIGFNFPTDDYAPGFLALVTPNGSIQPAADGIAYPHGMVVTPDNSTLIVAEAYANRLTAFDIAADGSLLNRRVWADLNEGVPHGISLDTEGAVWYADIPNQRCVRVREGGEVLHKIDLGSSCFACMLGGPEGKTLFMMAADWLGPESMADAVRTGQLLITEAPAAHAGWP
jgi:sugar lactone lactonase YvrE